MIFLAFDDVCFNFWYLILRMRSKTERRFHFRGGKGLQNVSKNKPVPENAAVTWSSVGVPRSRDVGFWSNALILIGLLSPRIFLEP